MESLREVSDIRDALGVTGSVDAASKTIKKAIKAMNGKHVKYWPDSETITVSIKPQKSFCYITESTADFIIYLWNYYNHADLIRDIGRLIQTGWATNQMIAELIKCGEYIIKVKNEEKQDEDQ